MTTTAAMTLPEFTPFPKIPRLARGIIVTEKIDGTNGVIFISESGEIVAGSRGRWIFPGKCTDNHGFAGWVHENAAGLRVELPPGLHYGEWWGHGVGRGYGAQEKYFSLFNTSRFMQENLSLCRVVPVLFEGIFSDLWIAHTLDALRTNGSVAMPGYMKPEGVVIYHTASHTYFKQTLEKDEARKELCENRQIIF